MGSLYALFSYHLSEPIKPLHCGSSDWALSQVLSFVAASRPLALTGACWLSTKVKLWMYNRGILYFIDAYQGMCLGAIQIAQTLGATPIRYRSDAKTSDRYLIDVDSGVFAIWDRIYNEIFTCFSLFGHIDSSQRVLYHNIQFPMFFRTLLRCFTAKNMPVSIADGEPLWKSVHWYIF